MHRPLCHSGAPRFSRRSVPSTSFIAAVLGAAMSVSMLPAQAQNAKPAAHAPLVASAAVSHKDASAGRDAPAAASRFPESISGPLSLNGWGTRKRLGFEVYHVGYYTQVKSVNSADHLALAKPGRLVIRFARELENEQFTRILLAAMRERVSMTETTTMVESMQKFSEVFGSIPVFKVNDEVTLSVFPGGRMEFAINGDTKNFKPITEPALARGLLSIYVGNNPIDADLKRHLLEGGPKPGEGVARVATGGPRR